MRCPKCKSRKGHKVGCEILRLKGSGPVKGWNKGRRAPKENDGDTSRTTA